MPTDKDDLVDPFGPLPDPLAPVAREGSHLDTLRRLRDNLADAIDQARRRGLYAEVSSLTGRLQSVLDRIAQLAPDTGKGTALDEFTERRKARKAPGSAGAAKRQQRR